MLETLKTDLSELLLAVEAKIAEIKNWVEKEIVGVEVSPTVEASPEPAQEAPASEAQPTDTGV